MANNMKLSKIRIYGDPILKEKALPVKEVDGKILKFSETLLEMMLEYDGVGLAANQIGKRLRMIALNVPFPKGKQDGVALSPGESKLLPMMPLVFINPEILEFSPFEASKEEGCLSVPKIYAPVTRPVSIKFRAFLLDGEEVKCECGGLLARAIQHEIDHLDGIVFVDRISAEAKKKIAGELDKLLEKQTVSSK